MKISQIKAQEVLDSRGNPTVECDLTLENGMTVMSIVPSGASTGVHEALELRDGDANRYLGKGVLKAVENINTKIAPAIIGMDVENQEEIDNKMLELDGTENKANLGANAILSVSMACVKGAALAKGIPLYQYVAELFGNDTTSYKMPVPMVNVLNGGKHAIKSSDVQEYMFMPIGANSIQQSVQWCAECFHNLGKILKELGFATSVGDEGGYAPSLGTNEKPLELMVQAIEKSGLTPGKDMALGIDAAASEFYTEDGKYNLASEGRVLTGEELVDMYAGWIEKYPLISIEDGLSEDDWDGFKKLEEKLGDKIMNVGDDLYVTNVKRLEKGIEMHASNSILIKLNQIGSVTETINAIKMANEANMHSIVSHRSGETEDTFIADFVVGAGTGYIKTGSMSRSERIAKYNRLMRIERELESK
ncbi:phosphopyruvate hydratase [bacterium]|nr:phosphopyruvate hydratase [bacterium]